MSAPPPIEKIILKDAEAYLSLGARYPALVNQFLARLDILEAAASIIGGFDLRQFRERCSDSEPQLNCSEALAIAEHVVGEIEKAPIDPALALSALAREPLSKHEARTTGAHYTDFRLAMLIGELAAEKSASSRTVLDPACGSGILLAATAMKMASKGREMGPWLAENVIAADQSRNALRGATLALGSLTDDVGAIAQMRSRWLLGDSLLRQTDSWNQAIGDNLGVIVANPPWEKLKVLRHEHELAIGFDRHYGAAHSKQPSKKLAIERARMREYVNELAARYPLATNGETDLFAAFTQLMIQLAGHRGSIAALVPAGLIRSKSTMALRRVLMDRFSDLSFHVFDNKPRFFQIDTRFKFVAMIASHSQNATSLSIGFGKATDLKCSSKSLCEIDRKELEYLRPDLSIPEIRNEQEWQLFSKMNAAGQKWDDSSSPWYPKFCREVDMTRERPLFESRPTETTVPVVEGRMVHQFRFGAKRYISGTGRRAVWEAVPLGTTSIEPQFWINTNKLPRTASSRVQIARAGFCDIAGQTNERSMMATIIPAGSVCGNKVPTVIFPNLIGDEASALWCGMVNSFSFDWLLRRVLTTTVNYFLLQSVPLPPLHPSTLPGQRVARDAKAVERLAASGGDDVYLEVATLRRDIDLACFRAFGLNGQETELMLSDFPSLDRGEPPLPEERRSTITRDFILSSVETPSRSIFAKRAEEAMALGARPYRPSQSAKEFSRSVQALPVAT